MIIDFTSTKNKLDKIAYEHFNFIIQREGGFLNQINLHIHHEGHGEYSYQTVDRDTIEEHGELIESEFEIGNKDIEHLGIPDVLKRFEKVAIDMAKKQKDLAFKRMSEAVEKVGNVIDAKNKTFTESSLEMLEKIQIDFDEIRDKPLLPTIIVNPKTGRKLRDELKTLSSEEKLTYEQKQEEILNRKYEEYVLRESNRKLVD